MLTIETFLACLTAGAAAVGLWLAVRGSRLGPSSFRGVAVHVGAALLAGQAASPILERAVVALGPQAAAMLVVFPVLTYMFTAAAWTIMFFQGLLRPYIR